VANRRPDNLCPLVPLNFSLPLTWREVYGCPMGARGETRRRRKGGKEGRREGSNQVLDAALLRGYLPLVPLPPSVSGHRLYSDEGEGGREDRRWNAPALGLPLAPI